MRILIFTHAISRHENDHPQFINELCLAYQDAGHQVEILTASHASMESSRLDPRITFNFYRYAPRSLEQLGYGESLQNDLVMKPAAYLMAPFMLIMGVLALRRKVKTYQPDFVHAHWGVPSGVIAALAMKWVNTRLMISFPGSDVTAIGLNPVMRALGRFACRRADVLTTNSHDLRDAIVELGADLGKFHFVLYGSNQATVPVNTDKQAALRQQYGLAETDRVILAIGRLVPKKGFRYLLEALPLVETQTPFKVLIIGEGLEKPALEKIVQDYGIQNQVIFAGRVPYSDLPQYYHLADIFANPAVRVPVDGLNVVVPEAMKYKLPIAGTKIGGNELVVEEGINGYLAEEKNARAFADALSKLLDGESSMAQMGEHSRELFLARASWDIIARRYTDIVGSLTSAE